MPTCGMREPVTTTVSVAVSARAGAERLSADAVAAPSIKAARRLEFETWNTRGTPLVLCGVTTRPEADTWPQPAQHPRGRTYRRRGFASIARKLRPHGVRVKTESRKCAIRAADVAFRCQLPPANC